VISYAPSASSLAFLRRSTAPRPAAAGEVVAVGNPLLAGAGSAERRSAPSQSGFELDWIRDLRPLPHTRQELQRIAEIFGPAARVLEQKQAEETVVMRSLDAAVILHFATHGLIDEQQPDRSGLALTVRPPDSDGLLQMREIYRLRLPATRLVTLSACRTALGQEVTGEGMVGLSRAFFYAGAGAVLASLWNVNDSAAAQWMGIFYDAVHRGAPIDEAVRAAKLRFAASGTRLSHPFYWAGFIVTGHAGLPLDLPARRGWGLVPAARTLLLLAALLLIYLKARAVRKRRTEAAIE